MSLVMLMGCSREELPNTEEDGKGSLVIKIAQQQQYAGSKAVIDDPADRTIKTLRVWLVDGVGNIEEVSFTTPNATSSTVTINSIPRGEHKLYIVANYQGLDSYTTGAIDDNFKNKAMDVITSGHAPEYTENQGVPSSLVMDVAISAGVNTIQAHLIRSVGRFTVTFRNMVPDKDLYIGSIGLSKRNQSMGYLFPVNDHSNPAGSEDLLFPDLKETEVIKITAGNSGVAYDTYLYETTPAIGTQFKIQFSGGFVAKDAPQPSFTLQNGDIGGSYIVGDNTNVYDNESTFMIRSRASDTKYLGVNEGGSALVIKDFTGDMEILNYSKLDLYLWTFDSDGRITNVSSGKQLDMNSSTVSLVNNGSGREFTISTSGTGLTFSYTRYSSRYYLKINSSSNGVLGATGTSGNTHLWYLRKVTVVPVTTQYKKFSGVDPEVDYFSSYPVNFIDKYGAPQPLEHICRNEHINLTVNVTHNSELGTFNFEVEGWSSVTNETTFD